MGPHETRATYPRGLSPNSGTLWVTSDRGGEFKELMNWTSTASDRAGQRHIPWDVSGVTVNDDRCKRAAQFNVDGRDELRLFDADPGKEVPAAKVPDGNVGGT